MLPCSWVEYCHSERQHFNSGRGVDVVVLLAALVPVVVWTTAAERFYSSRVSHGLRKQLRCN